MSKVRVINLVPSPAGILLRAPPVCLAYDDAEHEVGQDLDLQAGVNENINLAAVDYWERHVTGLRFERIRDTVILSVDGGTRRLTREQLDRERLALERERIETERRALDSERQKFRARR